MRMCGLQRTDVSVDAVWLAPRFRAEISYAEVVAGKLRAPSWRGLVRP